MKLRTLTALASAALLTLVVAMNSGAGTACSDGDSDGVCDTDDNCVAIANPSQIDTNNDCSISVADITIIIPSLSFLEPPDSPYDVNLDGAVTVSDITLIIPQFGSLANGSGKACASCGPGTPTGVGAPGTCP